MTYRVTLLPSVVEELRTLDPTSRHRIQAAIELLANEPRPPAAIQLVGGFGEWRVRTGDFRIIYEIDDGELVVLVLRTGHRRDGVSAPVAGVSARPARSP